VSPVPVDEQPLVPGDWPGRSDGLTAREAEVVALITQGLSNTEIATRCYLSINSVKSYIRGAYSKIEVTSRSQAVLWAIQHGLLMTPEPEPSRARVPLRAAR
jgi:DNA-binding CsgD family transcriptional regulator